MRAARWDSANVERERHWRDPRPEKGFEVERVAVMALASGFAGMSTTNSSPIIAALGGKHIARTEVLLSGEAEFDRR